MEKYEFTGETKQCCRATLQRIRAVIAFNDVKKGDLGGWIEKVENLDNYGEAWVYDEAQVYGEARVYGKARVEYSKDLIVFQYIGSECGTFTAYKSEKGIECNRGCFHGTIQEFESAVIKIHSNNEYGKQYALIIELVKLRIESGISINEKIEESA